MHADVMRSNYFSPQRMPNVQFQAVLCAIQVGWRIPRIITVTVVVLVVLVSTKVGLEFISTQAGSKLRVLHTDSATPSDSNRQSPQAHIRAAISEEPLHTPSEDVTGLTNPSGSDNRGRRDGNIGEGKPGTVDMSIPSERSSSVLYDGGRGDGSAGDRTSGSVDASIEVSVRSDASLEGVSHVAVGSGESGSVHSVGDLGNNETTVLPEFAANNWIALETKMFKQQCRGWDALLEATYKPQYAYPARRSSPHFHVGSSDLHVNGVLLVTLFSKLHSIFPKLFDHANQILHNTSMLCLGRRNQYIGKKMTR